MAGGDRRARGAAAWPVGGGEMGALVRDHDWSMTQLGAVGTWPQSLRTAVDVMLRCAFPMMVLWGPDLRQLYNDRYRALMGVASPVGLGTATRDCTPEAWPSNEPLYRRVWVGETVLREDARHPVFRHGCPEDAWFTLCHCPLRDEAGMVAGVLVTVFETTRRRTAEAAREESERTLRLYFERAEFLLALRDRLRALTTPLEIMALASELLGRELAVTRAGYSEVDEAAGIATNYDWTDGTVPSSAGRHMLADWGPAIVASYRCGEVWRVDDVESDPRPGVREYATAYAALGLRAAFGAPVQEGGRWVALVFLHSSTPRAWTAQDVALIQTVAGRVWDAVKRARAEAALRESEARFRTLVQASSEVLYRMSPDWAEMQELSGGGFLADTEHSNAAWLERYIHPDDQPHVLQAIQTAMRTKGTFVLEHRVRRVDGSLAWTLSRAVPRLGADGEITEWFGAASDVTARKEAEAALRAALAEQQALLREVNHRVKNNLAVIDSLLSLQAADAEDARAQQVLTEAANRVRTIAVVQRLLYAAPSQALVDPGRFAAELAQALFTSYGVIGGRVCLALSGAWSGMGLEQAVPLGLIFNELFTNALKHAFPDGRTGCIEVRLEGTAGALEVADDGIGLPAAVDPAHPRSLGLQLVQGLVGQIGGTIQALPGPGTRYLLQFPPQSGR